MKTKHRLIATASVALISLGALSACGDNEYAAGVDNCKPKFKFSTIASGILTIAAYEGAPYYSEAGGKAEGIDYELLEKFAKDACLKTNWVVTPAASTIQSVVSKRADVAAGGWYATAERAEVVNQSDAIYAELPTIFAMGEAVDDITKVVGHTVGTITGYTWNDDLKKLLGDDKVKEYQGADAALKDLAAGRIDYAVLGGIDAPYLVKTKADEFAGITPALMNPDPAIAVSVNPSLPNYPHTKGNDDLTAALNEEIGDVHSSGFEGELLAKFGLDPALADTEQYQ